MAFGEQAAILGQSDSHHQRLGSTFSFQKSYKPLYYDVLYRLGLFSEMLVYLCASAWDWVRLLF